LPKTVRVFLLEDNRLLGDGIAAMLRGQRDLKVVVSAKGVDPLRQARETKPDIVLLAAGFGDNRSACLAATLREAAPEAKVVVMGLLPVQEDILELVRAGVSGFVLKDATLTELVGTIRTVAAGAKVLPHSLAGMLFSDIATRTAKRRAPEVTESERLTQRERQVIDLISDGLSNKEIAQGLCIATSTVKGHVHSILEKLALRTRLQIAAYARNGYRTTRSAPSSAVTPAPPMPPVPPVPPRVLRIERHAPPDRRRTIDG
jgi:two-component system, NarL family, nitrate/nitrite response regulator NarL